MEASAVPGAAPAGARLVLHPRLVGMSTDARLVELIRDRQPAAFEVLYDRYHRPVLSFCRHLLGDQQEAEDAVQQTFLAAWADLMRSDKPILLRGWLFTIARNRCLTILRARRDQPSDQLDEVPTEGLATLVQRRQDLRDLVLDMRRLPDDQRAALVLAELDALSHDDIADVLGVPRPKVKALVFQARESLLASRAARDADCAEIRRQLATQRGAALRRAHLRRHLRECSGCRDYRALVQRQRRQLAVLLPTAPTLALREAVMGSVLVGGGGAAVSGAGLLAGGLLKSGVGKGLAALVIAAVGTAGTAAVTHDFVAHHSAPLLAVHLRPPPAATPAAGGLSAALAPVPRPVTASSVVARHAAAALVPSATSGWTPAAARRRGAAGRRGHIRHRGGVPTGTALAPLAATPAPVTAAAPPPASQPAAPVVSPPLSSSGADVGSRSGGSDRGGLAPGHSGSAPGQSGSGPGNSASAPGHSGSAPGDGSDPPSPSAPAGAGDPPAATPGPADPGQGGSRGNGGGNGNGDGGGNGGGDGHGSGGGHGNGETHGNAAGGPGGGHGH